MLIYIIWGVSIYIVEEYAHIYNQGMCLFTFWRNMLIYIIQGCAYLHCGGICSYI